MNPEDPWLELQGFLGQLWEDSPSAEEKQKLMGALDAIRFLAATGQDYDFEDYRKSLDSNAPPLVIASFGSYEEAEAWLKNHPNPPRTAQVLIAGEYHRVVCSRENDLRRLLRASTLEYYLEEMKRDGLPAPVASFKTREEADAWLNSSSEPPQQVVVTIAGEPFLAVYHYRVNLRALYPLR